MDIDTLTLFDYSCLDSAALMAKSALSKRRNLPIGCVIALDEHIIGQGENAVINPVYDPGRHAEIEAIRSVPKALWERAHEMTLYTTLEPCIMCLSTIILHGIGRIVYGAHDKRGGGTCILEHLPSYYDKGGVPTLVGPVDPERFDKLYELSNRMFANLPCAVKE